MASCCEVFTIRKWHHPKTKVMAFKARLNFSRVRVLHCAYSLNRDVDAKGRPSSRCVVEQSISNSESTEDTSVVEAMVSNQYKPFSRYSFDQKIRGRCKGEEVHFEDGYIVKYSEELILLEIINDIKIQISARKLKLGNFRHIIDYLRL